MSLHELLNDMVALDVHALSPMEAMTALLDFQRRAIVETAARPPSGPTLGEAMRDLSTHMHPGPWRRPRPWVHVRGGDGLLHIQRLGEKPLCGIDPFKAFDADGDRFKPLVYQDCPRCAKLRAQVDQEKRS